MAPSLQSVLSSEYCGILRAVWGCGEGHDYVMSTESDQSPLLAENAWAVPWELSRRNTTRCCVTGNGVEADSAGPAGSPPEPQHGPARTAARQKAADLGTAFSTEEQSPPGQDVDGPTLQDVTSLLPPKCPLNGSPGKSLVWTRNPSYRSLIQSLQFLKSRQDCMVGEWENGGQQQQFSLRSEAWLSCRSQTLPRPLLSPDLRSAKGEVGLVLCQLILLLGAQRRSAIQSASLLPRGLVCPLGCPFCGKLQQTGKTRGGSPSEPCLGIEAIKVNEVRPLESLPLNRFQLWGEVSVPGFPESRGPEVVKPR